MLDNLSLIQDVYEKLDENAEQDADKLFNYLKQFSIEDDRVIKGNMPLPEDEFMNHSVESLNKLFEFSRKDNDGSFKVLKPELVEALAPGIFAFCVQQAGRDLLKTLCSVVNIENENRTPSSQIKGVTASSLYTQNSNVVENF